MERRLKSYNVRTGALYGSVIVANKHSEEGYLFEYRCGNIFLKGKGKYPFQALAEVRGLLKEKGLVLLCEGARKDVYPSGMAFASFLAYKVIMGKPASKGNLVNILDSTDDIDMIGSSEEQEVYRRNWINSLGRG